MLLAIRRALRKGIVAGVAFCAWAGIYPGIYFYAVTAQAGTFLNNAQAGANAGESAVSSAEYDATNYGSTDFNALGWQASATQMQAIENYYKPGNIGLSGGNALNSYAASQGALLQSGGCASGFPGAGNLPADWSATKNACDAVWIPFVRAANQIIAGDPGGTAAFSATLQGLEQSWNNAFSSANGTIDGIATDCTQAPGCNMVAANTVSATESALENAGTGLPSLESYCQSLPVNPAVNATDLENEATDLQSVATNLEEMSFGNPATQQLYDTCSYAEAYYAAQQGTGGLNGFTGTSGGTAFDSGANLNRFLQTTEGQNLENSILPIVEGNPDVFAQYYSPSDCTSSTTYYGNNGVSVTTPPTTGVNSGSNPSQSIGCNETSANGGLIQSFPDNNAEWIWGDSSQCGDVPSGTSETLMATLQNGGSSGSVDPGSPLSATVYFAAIDQGTLTIDNSSTGDTSQVTYNDNGQAPETAYSPDGWTSQAVTIEPGLNTVSISVQGNATAGDAASAIASIIGSNGTVLLDTNTSSTWSMVTGATTSVTTTTTAGTNEAVSNPSASVTSNICTGTPFRCLGTECHGLIGNQNLDFSKAVTASSALAMMQTSIQCAQGTSVAAGNCAPIIFGGTEMYCRTWPFSSIGITNNCCQEGMAGAGMPLGKYIALIWDSYKVATNPVIDNAILGTGTTASVASWGESAYTEMSGYAQSAWNFVSQPFVNLAESVGQELGSAMPWMSSVATAVGSALGGLVGGDVSSIASAIGSIIDGGFMSTIEAYLEANAAEAISSATGVSIGAANAMVSDIASFASGIMIAYAIYEIIQIIGQLLTACKQEEFQFGNDRKEDDCYIVGTYCAQSAPIIGCLMHKTTACCYQSPLAMIIASQIQTGQPNVAGGYGTAQNPSCAGFTPQELESVNWSQINLSPWLAILEQSGLIQTGNQSAAASFSQTTQDHPSGEVNPP